MNLKDTLKVLGMLFAAVAVVVLYCYARVDQGMTQEQVNQTLEHWIDKTSSLTVLIWSQIIVVAIAGIAYRIWRHRAETARSK